MCRSACSAATPDTEKGKTGVVFPFSVNQLFLFTGLQARVVISRVKS